MICEDCSFFIDEMCTDDMEGYVHKETGLPICRYNPNAILRKKVVECIGMEYYSLIYCNKQGDCIYSIVKAESHIVAERKAKDDVKLWEGFFIYSVNWLDKKRIDAGEIVFCGG